MMKLEIELPDWCAERHIYVFAGIELAAYKQYGEDWIRVKDLRCNKCGECCKGQYAMDPDPGTGWCVNLVQMGTEWWCKLGVGRPLACSQGDKMTSPHAFGAECCITYKEIKAG